MGKTRNPWHTFGLPFGRRPEGALRAFATRFLLAAFYLSSRGELITQGKVARTLGGIAGSDPRLEPAVRELVDAGLLRREGPQGRILLLRCRLFLATP
jgi:hypothetical protein